MFAAPHPDQLAGREVLLMGLGSFGGGVGCARALAARGARLTVTDLRPAEALRASLDALDGLDFRATLGEHREEDFARADWVVVNPAVPGDAPWLQCARDHGAGLTTEVNLALALARDVPAVAVTGTHGKSTTAALTAWLLRGLPGRTVLAGNLGGSLLEDVTGLGPHDRLVVELSSYQTERLAAPAGWPRVAVFTCLRPDHLDRHGDFAGYAAAKRRLLEAQDARGLVLAPAPERALDDFAAAAPGRVERPDPADFDPAAWGFQPGERPWPEDYRVASLQLAARAAHALGLPRTAVGPAFRGFTGLPHRLQELPAPAGCRIIDNGVATHPEPTEVALRHLPGRLTLVAGGHDKGLPLEDLARACARCARLHLFGAGGRRLTETLGALAVTGPELSLHAGCEDAVRAALQELAEAPATLLFSPSFASFDEYRNFRERALRFQELCRAFDPERQKTLGDEGLAAY